MCLLVSISIFYHLTPIFTKLNHSCSTMRPSAAIRLYKPLMTNLSNSFKVPFLGTAVPVFYASTALPDKAELKLDQEALYNFAPFKNWITGLETSVASENATTAKPFELRSIEIQSIDLFGSRKIGFLKLKADLIHPNGKPLPGVTVLRGGSVAMLVILQESDSLSKRQHIVLVDQPRVPAGATSFLEVPAGMIDEENNGEAKDNVFVGAAARELEEEIGLKIASTSDLIDLTNGKELYLSPGLLDETMRFYLHKVEMPKEDIEAMQGQLRERTEGSENEVITLRIVPIEDIHSAGVQDAKTFLALGLYSQYLNTKST